MENRFGAEGDFAEAYVIAHEVGHHIQTLLGTNEEVQRRSQEDPSLRNELSVRLELQADCFAGVWGRSRQAAGILSPGDIEEGMNAAAAIGDDRIQEATTGRIDPESFTHGTAEQRVDVAPHGPAGGQPRRLRHVLERRLSAGSIPAVTARILDGKAVAAQIRSEVSDRVRALAERGVTPGLAAVLVGDDQASRIYVGQKHKACADVGIRSEQIDLPAYVTEHELLATIRRLNRDPDIHGIIVQLPLPGHLHELEIQRAVAPEKDVDGLHPLNIGMMLRQGPAFLPATPYGIVELMLRCEVPIEGAEVLHRRATATSSARRCR